MCFRFERLSIMDPKAVRAQERHFEDVRLTILRTDKKRALRVDDFAPRQIELVELLAEVAGDLQAVSRRINLGGKKRMPAFGAPSRLRARWRSRCCSA
jgi:hypothetical protein